MYSLANAVRRLLAALALACISNTAFAAFTELDFQASDESWVASGLSISASPALGYSFSGTYSGDEIIFFVSGAGHDWTLDIMAPDGLALALGKYTDTAHPPFLEPGQAGLAFFGDGRIDNQDSGFFSIRELSVNSGGEIDKLAVDFTQYGEGNPDWLLSGQLRYNSSIPAIPEPSEVLMLLVGLPLVLRACRSRMRTVV